MANSAESHACGAPAVRFADHTLRSVVYGRLWWQQDLRPDWFNSRTGWCTLRNELPLKGSGTPVAVSVTRVARIMEEHK